MTLTACDRPREPAARQPAALERTAPRVIHAARQPAALERTSPRVIHAARQPAALERTAPRVIHTFERRKITVDQMTAAGRFPSVYARKAKVVAPLARTLCAALHGLAARRKQACCAGTAADVAVITAQCVDTLAATLEQGSVTLDPARVDACVAALDVAHTGCAWVGPWAPATPNACLGLFAGTRRKGARCRSSLECKGGLRCHGAGPLDYGMCGAPKATGHMCGASVDSLAAYARQDDLDQTHPECAGFCRQHRCAPQLRAGQACDTNVQCGAGHHCDGKRCVRGATARTGSTCADTGCEAGSRCYKGRCAKPGVAGQRCLNDFECRGACLQPDLDTPGVCGQRCAPRFAVTD